MDDQFVALLFSAAFGAIATVFGQWLRRDKTDAEAGVDDAHAEKIRADAITALYGTIISMSSDIQKQVGATMAQSLEIIEYIKSLETCRRDISRMEDENRKRDRLDLQRFATITALQKQVAELTTFNVQLEKQVAALTASKMQLESEVADLTTSSSQKDALIETMRSRLASLESQRDDLDKKLQAKVSPENGNGAPTTGPSLVKPAANVPAVGEKLPESDK